MIRKQAIIIEFKDQECEVKTPDGRQAKVCILSWSNKYYLK